MKQWISVLLGAALVAAFSYPAFGQSQAPTLVIPVVIAAGNTFQAVPGLSAGASARRSLTIQNNNTSGDNCWVFLGTLANATKGTSILLQQGQAYSRYGPFIPSDAINVTCAATSDTMYVDTQ